MRRLLAITTMAAIAMGTTACTGGGDSAPSAEPAATATGDVSDRYGRAVEPSGSVTLADDVVVVGGGSDSVRSVSSDGLVWTLDADAPGADRLAVGSVLFVTDAGLGRVAGLERAGDTVTATIMPVALTEVIHSGEFAWEQGFDPSAMQVRVTPDAPGAFSEPATLLPANAEPVDVPGPGEAISRNSRPILAAASTLPPPSRGGAAEVTVGPWSVEPSVSNTQAAIKFGYNLNGVVFGGEVAIGYRDLKVIGDLTIHNGTVRVGSLTVDGIHTVALKLVGGSEVGQSGNIKARVEVPVEFNIPANVEGLPFNLSFRWKFIVETAFSAKNSTISAEGAYRLDGPVSMSINGTSVTLIVPQASRIKSLLNSLDGISVGVNGVVVAAQFKLLFGLGTAHAMLGPFASFNISTGLTNGSSIGLIRCKQGSLQIELAGGVGATLSTEASKALAGLATKLGVNAPGKIDVEAGAKRVVVSRSGVVPNVPLCRGPG